MNRSSGGHEYAFVEWRGMRHALGRHGSTESWAAYQRFLDERVFPALAQRADNNGQPQAVRHVSELLRAYLGFAGDYYGRESSECDHFVRLGRLLAAEYGRDLIDAFGPLKLERLRERMIAIDWCRGYINQQVLRLRRMFRWGVSQEIVPPDVLAALEAVAPLRAGKTAARETEAIQPVLGLHVAMILPHVLPVVADMIWIQWLTGMRSGELCVMRPAEIDCDGDIWVYSPHSHKTSHREKSRSIALGPTAQARIAPYLNRDAAGFLFSPAEAIARRHAQRRARRASPTTPSQRKRKRKAIPERKPGARYNTASYRRAIKTGCKAAKIPCWTPHQLRHTHATTVRARFGLEAAQVAMGHSRADVTQIYAERDLGLAVRIAAEIG